MFDIIRFGRISSVNYEAGLARVVYNDRTDGAGNKSVTRELPYLSFWYEMPEVDDSVVVLHMPNGGTKGLVLGRYWSQKNQPPEGKKGLFRKWFSREPDDCYLRYDPDNGELYIKNKDGARVEVKSHVLEAEQTYEVKAGSTVTIKGDGKVLVQSAVAEISGDSAVNITGGNVDIRGDSGNIRIGVIGFLEHKHNCTAPGTPSGPAIP